MEGKKVNVEDIDGACNHTVTTGEVTFPDGEKVESVLVMVNTPVGTVALHMSPSSAAKMAADLAATALEIAKRESERQQRREVNEIEAILDALRGFKAGKAH